MADLLTPTNIFGAASVVAPETGSMGKRFKNRYDVYSRALLETPYDAPGGPVLPTDAQDFIQKRAALQGTEKIAISGKQIKNLAGTILSSPGKSLLIGGSLIGLGSLTGPTIDVLGKRLQKTVVPGIRERELLDEETAKAFAISIGKEMGKKTIGLLADVLSKAVQAPAEILSSRARAGVFQVLQKEDEVIGQANTQQLTEAYHTMVRFAPTLATDKNAVKTFLRESVLYGTGPNFISIKQLADAEKAVNPPALVKVSR